MKKETKTTDVKIDKGDKEVKQTSKKAATKQPDQDKASEPKQEKVEQPKGDVVGKTVFSPGSDPFKVKEDK